MKHVSHVHKEVAAVAKEAAAELYEVVMSNDQVYGEWKRQHPGLSSKGLLNAFVKANWPHCIALARATMARLLTTPIDAELKERIMDALVLDNQLVAGRKDPAVLLNSKPQGEA